MPCHFKAWALGCRLLLGFILAWACSSAIAHEQTLQLNSSTHSFNAAGHMQMLLDPGSQLNAPEAEQAGGWQSLPGNLSAGFSNETIWLRIPFEVEAMSPGGWMLRLSNALLDDVQVYLRQASGHWLALGTSGEDVPRALWPVDYRSPTFEFSSHENGPQWLLIRLQSKNALTTRVEIWPRLTFDNYSRREGLFFGLYFGFYLLLICLHAGFWWMTRAWMSGLFLAYIGGSVLNEALTLGLIQQITSMPVFFSDRLLGVGLAFSLFISLQVAFRQLDLSSLYPRLTRWGSILIGLLAVTCMTLVLSGHYAWGVMPVQWVALLLIVAFIVLDARLLAAGYRPARFFALAFGVFYLGIFIGFLRNLGVLPLNAWTEHASALGTMIHMVLLGMYLVWRHESERRARERKQANLVAELALEHNQQLEHQVETRTQELRQEIQRRQHLEEELRSSLTLERKVRNEQREFVAMVSHEFRTPLAIIGTSAQQLGRNLDAPAERSLQRCQNIRDASRRLLTLVDEYLTDDRIEESQAEALLRPSNLQTLLEALVHELPPDRVACQLDGDVDGFVTDPSLLHIALRNLLANADRHSDADATLQLHLTRHAHGLVIDVSNPGMAISQDDQQHLFDKYYRGNNALHKPGAGLGLYLVKRIAEKLGGDAQLIRSGVDGTVCFRLTLPSLPDQTGLDKPGI